MRGFFRISSTFALGCGLALALILPFGGANARGFAVLYSFTAGTDGAFPSAGLIADKAGNLYGTTAEGGGIRAGCNGFGCGTVFKLAPDGTETVLYTFQGGSDGSYPTSSVIADATGNLYGTTVYGGNNACQGQTGNGCGTVFKLAPNGTETVLYAFAGGGRGAHPGGSLIADKAGNLYGTTPNGGRGGLRCRRIGGCGTIFKIAPSGAETVLHSFRGGNGSNPRTSLIADKSGNLFGTTPDGGNGGNGCNCGTVFELTAGGIEKVLHRFGGSGDGMFPEAGLLADTAGNLYGTTDAGGGAGCGGVGCGIVFALAPDGTETVLYAFTGGKDGANPDAGLIADRSGNLYSTAGTGGAGGNGTVFKLAPGGTVTVLHAFNSAIGNGSTAGLIADKMGNLFGTTAGGGNSTNCNGFGCGTVFVVKK